MSTPYTPNAGFSSMTPPPEPPKSPGPNQQPRAPQPPTPFEVCKEKLRLLEASFLIRDFMKKRFDRQATIFLQFASDADLNLYIEETKKWFEKQDMKMLEMFRNFVIMYCFHENENLMEAQRVFEGLKVEFKAVYRRLKEAKRKEA